MAWAVHGTEAATAAEGPSLSQEGHTGHGGGEAGCKGDVGCRDAIVTEA